MSIWSSYRPGVTALGKNAGTDPMEPPEPVVGGQLPPPNPAPQEMGPPPDPNRAWFERQAKSRRNVYGAFNQVEASRTPSTPGTFGRPTYGQHNRPDSYNPVRSAQGPLTPGGAFNAAVPRLP